MTAPVTAFLGLGGNVGDAVETLTSAVYALHDSAGIAVEDVSGIYESPPWGPVEQPSFANCVVRVRTTLGPDELLLECQTTEAAYGRDRASEVRWGPRTLDVDILLYGDEAIDRPELTVPHPRLAERAFALVPLLEVFPGGTLPDGRRLTRLLLDLGPIEDLELIVRLEEVPGQHVARPEARGGAGAFLAEEWHAGGRPEPAPPDEARP